MVIELGKRIHGFDLGTRNADLLGLGRGAAQRFPAADPMARLARVARRRALHPAYVFRGEAIRYGELVTRVGQLAARLVELSVTRDSRVAVCVPRGLAEPVALLSVWAAGGAYVPLDPSHPNERTRVILEDARPEVLITDSTIAQSLDVPDGVRVLMLDVEREALARRKPMKLERAKDPEQLAYILFTSGSTGRPKGVGVPRRAIANFLRSMAHTPGIGEHDRLLSVTTITFDIAGLELFLPLWVGATAYLADKETALDAHKLMAALERHDITMFQATPTTYRLLFEAGFGEHKHVAKLRMLCGGEAMSRELARRITEAGGELWNMYGPTETTVWSTVCRIPCGAHTISIGRPIDETQVYVLDEELKLVPRGEVGELCIGGLGVARGYFERDDLTARRFVQNPYGPKGDRIYRTGDLGRWLENGELECLGRVDHQVKIRGFRIELGEIESCLRSVEGVREVVVVARSRNEGDPELVGYFVGDANVAALRARVKEALPNYMHPLAYMRLESFPLNTNGKVDRQQLPEPSFDMEPEAESRNRAPRNDAELAICALVAEILKVPAPPLDVDLFALGATSVRVMELRRRIRAQLGVELPLSAMFEAPTIERLAEEVASGRQSHGGAAFVPLVHGAPDMPPLLCLMGVALYRHLAKVLGDGRTVHGIHVPYDPADGSFPRIEDVAKLYVDAIVEQVPRGPYHVAGLCFGGIVAYEVAQQLLARGHQVGSVTVLDAALPRAEHYSATVRIKELAKGVICAPAHTWSRLREQARALFGAGQSASPATPRKYDFDVDSPLAQAMVAAYERNVRPIAAPLLVCRASDRAQIAWRSTDHHLGWLGLSRQLSIAAVPGSHLEILREPYVEITAAAMRRVLAGPSLIDARSAEEHERDKGRFSYVQ